MRFLEAAPERYDAGMAVITLGRIRALHDAVAEAAVTAPGKRVLEIGCGTGAVTSRLVARGAQVTALDQNPEMLERAREHVSGAAVEWLERTAAEIDTLPVAHYDAVVASLSLSEMSPAERGFVLERAAERLAPGGRIVIGDEVRPRSAMQHALHAVLRTPQALLAWLLAGSTSKPIPDLAGELESAGLRVQSEQRWLAGSLAVVVAEQRPA
jgi:ubiquinone/menaquinone biosynthesis C-methylase UbiE